MIDPEIVAVDGLGNLDTFTPFGGSAIYITPASLAECLGLHPQTVRSWMSSKGQDIEALGYPLDLVLDFVLFAVVRGTPKAPRLIKALITPHFEGLYP